MATRFLARSLLTSKPPLSSSFSHYCGAAAATSSAVLPNSSSFIFRLRPIVAAASSSYFRRLLPAISTRAFSTRPTASSLNDPNPNWSNRPPKETILLDGCDFEHWLVVVEKPEGDPTRDEIIDSYIKTLSMVIGSEEEARMKIYSVSTRHYYAFGALVSEELSYKLKELPKVRWVLPDSYLDVKNKDYGGEPFINGQAVPYDPKYHEEWVRNNARANERNRRNDRPRNFDRSRNFERRREMQSQNPGGPGSNYGGGPPANAPGPNMGGQPNYGGAPPNNPGNYSRPPPNNFQQGPASNSGGMPYQPGPAPNQGGFPAGGPGPNQGGFPAGGPGPNQGGFPAGGPGPNQGGFPAGGPGPNQGPYANAGGGSPYQNQNYPGGENRGFGPGPNAGNFGPNAGYGAGPTQNNFAPNAGSGPGQYQNAYGPNAGSPSQGQNIPGRDFPPSSNY